MLDFLLLEYKADIAIFYVSAKLELIKSLI